MKNPASPIANPSHLNPNKAPQAYDPCRSLSGPGMPIIAEICAALKSGTVPHTTPDPKRILNTRLLRRAKGMQELSVPTARPHLPTNAVAAGFPHLNPEGR